MKNRVKLQNALNERLAQYNLSCLWPGGQRPYFHLYVCDPQTQNYMFCLLHPELDGPPDETDSIDSNFKKFGFDAQVCEIVNWARAAGYIE